VRVVLFTQATKQDPDNEPFQQDELVDRLIQKRARKYDRAKHQGLLQYWTGYLTVKAYSDRVITQQKGKLTTRGTNEFKLLYRICMTDANFKERELKAPGYLDGIYVLEWTAIGAPAEQEAPAANPEETPKRAAGDKVAIQFKYCSHQLDLSKRTFREALQKRQPSRERVLDQQALRQLRADPAAVENLITRETILEGTSRRA